MRARGSWLTHGRSWKVMDQRPDKSPQGVCPVGCCVRLSQGEAGAGGSVSSRQDFYLPLPPPTEGTSSTQFEEVKMVRGRNLVRPTTLQGTGSEGRDPC